MKKLMLVLLCFVPVLPAVASTFVNGDVIVSTFEGTVDRYDASTGLKVESLATGLGHAGATAFDSSGRLWAGAGGGTIQVWNSAGWQMTIQAATQLPDNDICGLAKGPDGYMYAIDRYEKKIRKFDASTGASMGVVADVAALYPTGIQPADLKFGPDGNIWIPMANMSVQRFSTAGALLSTYFTDVTLGGSNTTTSAPGQIAFGTDGNHFMYNSAQYHGVSILRNFDTAWVGIWNNWSLDGAKGLALADDGTWYVSNGSYGTITKFNAAMNRFDNWATGVGNGQYLSIINVPEPMTMCLLGLGAIGLLRKK